MITGLLAVKSARFAVCHTQDMTREDLLKLRNDLIQQPIGGMLLDYLSDYITAEACKNRNAEQIKGMCELLQRIKDIPREVNKLSK